MVDQYLTYLDSIDPKKDELTEQLVQWVNVHSGSDHLEGLKLMFNSLASAFESLEGEIEEIPLPPRKIMNKRGLMIEEQLGHALRITKRPDAEIQVLFGGHMDIALSRKQTLKKCLLKNTDTLVGRGSVDMKGGLLILLQALLCFEDSPFAERIGWEILITPDEEVGSPGSQSLWNKAAKGKKVALIFEPSFPDGNLVSARKGSANFTLSIKGKSAHAGRSFHEGENAILAASRFALAAESLNDLASELTVNIGFLNGGGPVNVVPDSALLKFNIRCQTPQELQLAQTKLKEIVNIENNRENIQASLYQDSLRPPKIFDKRTRTVFEALKRSGKSLGINLDWHASGGVCDGNILANQGLVTIDTLGAVGGGLHTEGEYVKLQSLVDRSKLTARFLMQIAAGEIQIP